MLLCVSFCRRICYTFRINAKRLKKGEGEPRKPVRVLRGKDNMKLSELRAGESGRIEAVGGEGALRQHFLDMGVIPGAEVTLVKLAPMGADAAPCRRRKDRHHKRRKERSRRRAAFRPQALGPPGPGRGREVPSQGHGRAAAGRNFADLRPRGQPELRQDDTVQPADRCQPACGQFPWRDRRSQRRLHPRSEGHLHHRSAGDLFHVALFQRGAGLTQRQSRRRSSISWTRPTSSAICI